MQNVTEVSKAELLESIYRKFHKKEYLHPDPLELVLNYTNPADQEIAGIIASSFATGRVKSIVKAVSGILALFPDLRSDLLKSKREKLEELLGGFRYRFYNSRSLIEFLEGIKKTIIEFGSLENCFKVGMMGTEEEIKSVFGGMTFLVDNIEGKSKANRRILPVPENGSAMKRLNMFLRWMVRKDSIDPGPWNNISAADLIIPLDTHIMQISRILGFTDRKQSDRSTALEITKALKVIDPEDPVRFDFSLSRLGIHPDLSYNELLQNGCEIIS